MSKRGLTFSFKENDTFRAGTRYRYVVDIANSEVVIIPDDNGRYKMSRKGANCKPLVDLRNEEIRNVMSAASYMEVEVLDDRIVVHIVKASPSVNLGSDAEIVDFINRSDNISFEISKDDLLSHDDALSEMLGATGLFDRSVRDDVRYVFDTVSLFSGAGLLDYPFAKDGSFNMLFACDRELSACRTYRENIGEHILHIDIQKLDEKSVPGCELVVGGIPCVGFSNANRTGNTALDMKNRFLVDDYIRIVREKRPLAFVIENVPQFISCEDGRYLQKLFAELSDYNITYSVINDSDVGGYTTRERVILIGTSKKMPRVVIPDVVVSERKTVKDALSHVTPDWFNYNDVTGSSAATIDKMSRVRPGHNFRDIEEMKHLPRHSNVYRRLEWDKPSCTIGNWRKYLLMPPEGNRILSVAEASALMGLNKDFKFFGSLNDRQQQCGNGVTQAIATFVKDIVKNALYGFMDSILMPRPVAVLAA